MPPRYLLPCECGQASEVLSTQAGESVSCACGRTSRVPNLSQLRRLQVVAEEADNRRNSKPAFRRRLPLVLAPLFLLGTAIAGWYGWTRHHLSAAQSALEHRDFLQAEAHLQHCLSAGMMGSSPYVLVAQSARQREDYEAAEKQLARCERRFGSTPDIERERRLLSIQQGNLQGADELLEAHEQRGPAAAQVLEAYIRGSLAVLGSAYLREQVVAGSDEAAQVHRTLAAIERWLQLCPQPENRVQGLVWRFRAYICGHEREKAWADLSKALELDPQHYEARRGYAAYLMQEQPREAAVQLQALHEQSGQDHQITLLLADARRRLGELEEAEQLLDSVLAVDLDNVTALLERGRVSLDMHDPKGAEQWFRRAWQRAPDSLEAISSLSRCLRAAGKDDEARRLQEKFDAIVEEWNAHRDSALHSPQQPETN